MSNCPRCAKPLEEAQVDTFTVRLCHGCTGLLVAHPDLMEILERSWRSIPAGAAEAEQFIRPEQPAADSTLRCPACFQAMDKYGYMGLAAIMLDRCDRCSLLWLDADELQRMVLALAKSNHRAEKRRRAECEQVDLFAAGVTGAMAANQNPVANSLPGGIEGHGQRVLVEVVLGLLLRR